MGGSEAMGWVAWEKWDGLGCRARGAARGGAARGGAARGGAAYLVVRIVVGHRGCCRQVHIDGGAQVTQRFRSRRLEWQGKLEPAQPPRPVCVKGGARGLVRQTSRLRPSTGRVPGATKTAARVTLLWSSCPVVWRKSRAFWKPIDGEARRFRAGSPVVGAVRARPSGAARTVTACRPRTASSGPGAAASVSESSGTTGSVTQWITSPSCATSRMDSSSGKRSVRVRCARL